MAKYVCNTFTLSMLQLPHIHEEKTYTLNIKNLSLSDANEYIKSNILVNAIGHQGTVDLINTLFNTNFTVNRIEIKLSEGDEILVIQLLTRLPEGKVLSKEEMEELLQQGKINFLLVKVGGE